jgi:hypothetical protein
MKTRFILSCIALLFCFAAGQIGHAQKSGQSYVFIMKSGSELIGKVIDVRQDTIMEIQLEDGRQKTVPSSEVARIEPIPNLHGSMGTGIGIPYGIIGINAEYEFVNHFSVGAGLGYAITGSSSTASDIFLGYSIGVRAYALPPRYIFRPRVGLFYGTNGLLQVTTTYIGSYYSSSSSSTVHTGFNASAGLSFRFTRGGRIGVDLDVLYQLSSTINDKIDELKKAGYTLSDEPSKVGVSLGFRYFF